MNPPPDQPPQHQPQVLSYGSPASAGDAELGRALKPRLRLGLVAWVALLIFWVIEYVWGLPLAKFEATEPKYAVTYMMGKLVLSPLIILFITWAIWRIARRPRYLATALFTSLILFITVTEYRGAASMRRRLANSVLSTQLAAWNQAAAATRSSAEKLTGVTPAELQDPARLDARIADLDHAIADVREATGMGDRIAADLDRQLADIGMSRGERDREIARFSSYVRWPATRKELAADEKLYGAMRAMLQFLKDHPGQWSPGENIAAVRWEMAEQANQYLKLRRDFTAAAKEVAAAQAATTAPAPKPAPNP